MGRVVSYPNHQKLPLLAKTNLMIKDIQILCECGIVRAQELRKKYFEWCVANNIKLYDSSIVNTDLFIRFTNEDDTTPPIDVARIEKYAKKGY